MLLISVSSLCHSVATVTGKRVDFLFSEKMGEGGADLRGPVGEVPGPGGNLGGPECSLTHTSLVLLLGLLSPPVVGG